MALGEVFKIFIVDDDRFSLAIYEQHLRNLGFAHICTFDNARDCLKQLSQKPELVFAGLGQLEAISLIKEIKSVDTDIYVIFLSASEDPLLIRSAFQSGAYACIPKTGPNEARLIAHATSSIITTLHLLRKRSYKEYCNQ